MRDDLAPAFDRLAKREAQALIVPVNGLFQSKVRTSCSLLSAHGCRRSLQNATVSRSEGSRATALIKARAFGALQFMSTKF